VSYEEIEKDIARNRLRRIVDAVADFPGEVDPILQETDLLELLRLAEFANRELQLHLTDARLERATNDWGIN